MRCDVWCVVLVCDGDVWVGGEEGRVVWEGAGGREEGNSRIAQTSAEGSMLHTLRASTHILWWQAHTLAYTALYRRDARVCSSLARY